MLKWSHCVSVHFDGKTKSRRSPWSISASYPISKVPWFNVTGQCRVPCEECKVCTLCLTTLTPTVISRTIQGTALQFQTLCCDFFLEAFSSEISAVGIFYFLCHHYECKRFLSQKHSGTYCVMWATLKTDRNFCWLTNFYKS